jgi:hypothetical protein
LVNIKYERTTAEQLKPGDLFATADNPGVRALHDMPVVNVGAPPGAIAFGHFHVRTDEPIRDLSDAKATCYRVTIEVL